ncbi:MAG: replication initiation protein [Lachnospiraceae bacterium]
MPKKKADPIVSLGSDTDKLTVQKSHPLFALWRSDLTLAEFKILDTYLSRIDSHKPEKRTVQFEKGELEELLGVQKINVSELKDRLSHLMCTVDLTDPDKPNAFRKVALFEEAYAEQDHYGLWDVSLTCTQKAMQYFFNVDNIGYLRYKLRCITSLTSRYTYVMFTYLEANRFRTPWKEDLDELRKILNCDKEETYKEYKRFNDLILKKVRTELIEKTECKYDYVPVKKGRNVVAIEFKLKTLPKIEADPVKDPDQKTIDQYLNEINSALWESALCDKNGICAFTREQLNEIQQILVVIPESKLPQSEACYGDIEMQRYHYIAQQYAILKRKNSEKRIKNMFAYFVKMLHNEAGTEG